MPTLNQVYLELARCPFCGIDKPRLEKKSSFVTDDHLNQHRRLWMTYACTRCGGVVTASSPGERHAGEVAEMYPVSAEIDASIPERSRAYLVQAVDSLNAPAASIVTAASSVDSMLKQKGYKEGSLYSRIEQAEREHLITHEMAAWAHEIRLDANDQRHADESVPLPSIAEAKKVIDFAKALGELLFVLPARVARGRAPPNPST